VPVRRAKADERRTLRVNIGLIAGGFEQPGLALKLSEHAAHGKFSCDPAKRIPPVKTALRGDRRL
jgi:hypothetical protein